MKIKIFILGLILASLASLAITFFVSHFILDYYQNRPVPEYYKTDMSETEICSKIKNSQNKQLCFEMIRNPNFSINVSLVADATNNNLKDFPWYYTDLGDPKNIDQGCNTFICLAYLKNPYYCDKFIDRLSELNGRCFYNVAIIYQDANLCKLSIDPDFCFLNLVLLKQKDNKQ
jgi:hypothetical protein